MSNLINPMLSIGIQPHTPLNESLGKRFFNLDCLFTIFSVIIFVTYCIFTDFPYPIITLSLLIGLAYGLALFLNKLGHYKKAIYLATFFSYGIIAYESFIIPYFWVPFFLVQLGVSFFIYTAHVQKKPFYLFIFFTFSAVFFFVLSQFSIHRYHREGIVDDTFPIILFFSIFLVKISTLIFIYQKIIKESAQKEKVLQTTKNKYQIQFENTQLGIILLDNNFDFYDLNPSFCKMIGFSKEDILGCKDMQNCLINSPEFIALLTQLRSSKIKHFEVNKTFSKKDGSDLITSGFISGIYNDQNELICANCSFLDITQKVKTEEFIQKSESKYRDIFENMHDSIIILDMEGNITEFNTAANKLLEIEKLHSVNIKDFIHAEDTEKIPNYFYELKHKGFYTSFEARIRPHKSKLKYVEVDSVAIKDEEGNYIGSRNIVKDITNRKLTEAALKENESRYRTIFENAFEGVIIYDINRDRWTECNSRILEMLDTNQKRLFRNTTDFFPEYQENNESSISFFRNKLNDLLTEKNISFQCLLQDSKGKLLNTEITSCRIPAPFENLVVSIFKDVTDKNKQETIIQDSLKKLNKKNIDLQKYIESNMQLKNFAYMASHDLKAPLRTIISYIQLIHRRAKHKLDESEMEFLDFIIGASKNMGKLIDALLAYSKVDSQEKAYKFFNIETLLYSITQELQTDIKENEITIQFNDIPDIIYADPTRLRQLFQNLISNSIKFKSADQPPLIKISCRETKTDYEFSLQDNGIGIKAEFFDKIFSLFTKLHGGNEYEGTGIGLALCKKIVEQHEGKIWLKSRINQGTTFFFTISKSLSEENNNIKSVNISSMMN